MYEVTGFERKTGRLVAFYDASARRLSSVKNAAGVPSSDDGLVLTRSTVIKYR